MVILQGKTTPLGKFLKKYAFLLKKIDPGLAAAARKTFLHIKLSKTHQEELKKAFKSINEETIWQDFIQILLDNQATIIEVFKDKNILCYSETVTVKKEEIPMLNSIKQMERHWDLIRNNPHSLIQYLVEVYKEVTKDNERVLSQKEVYLIERLLETARKTDLRKARDFSFALYAETTTFLKFRTNDYKVKTSKSQDIKKKYLGENPFDNPVLRVSNPYKSGSQREETTKQEVPDNQLSGRSKKLQRQNSYEEPYERSEGSNPRIFHSNSGDIYYTNSTTTGIRFRLPGEPNSFKDSDPFEGAGDATIKTERVKPTSEEENNS